MNIQKFLCKLGFHKYINTVAYFSSYIIFGDGFKKIKIELHFCKYCNKLNFISVPNKENKEEKSPFKKKRQNNKPIVTPVGRRMMSVGYEINKIEEE